MTRRVPRTFRVAVLDIRMNRSFGSDQSANPKCGPNCPLGTGNATDGLDARFRRTARDVSKHHKMFSLVSSLHLHPHHPPWGQS